MPVSTSWLDMRSQIPALVAALLFAASLTSCTCSSDETTLVECEVTCDGGDVHTYPNYVPTGSCDEALAEVEVNRDLWIGEFCGAADRGTSSCRCKWTRCAS